jgi:hypothetical protein
LKSSKRGGNFEVFSKCCNANVMQSLNYIQKNPICLISIKNPLGSDSY